MHSENTVQSLHVKFILPALAEAESTVLYRPIKYALFPPLGLALLAGYLRKDRDRIEICDLHVEKTDFSDSPDLVAIEVYITNARRAYRIADAYRKRGIFVVLGGLHPTSLPEEALLHADSVVTGPAHAAWPEFLSDFRKGKAHTRRLYSDTLRSLARLPSPRRDLIRRERYLVPNSIVVSRGCPQSCDFCYTRNFYAGGKTFYTETVDSALSQIQSLPGRHLFFLDDNLFGSPSFAKALFSEMTGMKRIFQGAATLRSLEDDELLDLAAEAGLRSLFIGFESLNQESLSSCGKGINRVAEYRRLIRRLQDRGIMINASFVFGLDADRKDVFDRTVDWAVSSGIETATFHLATPYPGTPFFRRMEAGNRLLHRDWDRYDTRHAVIRHPHMSAEELESGYRRAYRNFYQWSSIFRSASRHSSLTASVRHFAYASAWKKMDPFWTLLIHLRRLPSAVPLLERALALGSSGGIVPGSRKGKSESKLMPPLVRENMENPEEIP